MNARSCAAWIVLLSLLVMGGGAAVAEEASTGAVRTGGTVSYDMRVRELEDRVNSFKEEVFRAKARLFLLREQVLQDRIGGSRVELVHVNALRRYFDIERVLYRMNGVPVLLADRSEGIDQVREQVIYEANVPPGPHVMQVEMLLRGRAWGPFTYMSSYRVVLQDAYPFFVDDGMTVTVTARLQERRGVNLQVQDRPEIRFSLEVRRTIEQEAIGDAATPRTR